MLKYLFKRLNQDEQGFTLVELLVVIVILGVLMGIGIPTYRGFVKRSHEAATIAELTAVSNAMKYAEIEDLDLSFENLQRYLGDSADKGDLAIDGVFMEKYQLAIKDDKTINATTAEDNRLSATITKNGVVIGIDD